MFDPFFTSKKSGHSPEDEEERQLYHGMSKDQRYELYQRLKIAVYAGEEITGGERLFYQDVKNRYNSAYHQHMDENRLREEPA